MPADRSLLEMQQQLETRDSVLSALSEGVLLFDPGGALLYANPAAQLLLEPLPNSTEPSPPGSLPARLRNALAGDAQATRVPVARHIELGSRVIEATSYPAQPSGSVAIVVRDVTDVRGVERLRRDFVANASHELKTPVASILALAETLRAAAHDPAASARLLTRLEQEAARLTSLARDLLALSRLEEAAPPDAAVDLRLVVDAAAGRLQGQAEARALRLEVNADERDLPVRGSDSDLARMVHNLLDNAIRYTPEGGVISVAVRRSGRVVEVAVTDSGVGIAEEHLARVFERFYRVDDSRARETGGTGLGLSIVRTVAQAHGGDVDVVSTPGRGSTFTVRLPALERSEGPRARARRGTGTPDRAR